MWHTQRGERTYIPCSSNNTFSSESQTQSSSSSEKIRLSRYAGAVPEVGRKKECRSICRTLATTEIIGVALFNFAVACAYTRRASVSLFSSRARRLARRQRHFIGDVRLIRLARGAVVRRIRADENCPAPMSKEKRREFSARARASLPFSQALPL